MNNEIFDNFNTFGKTAYEAMKELYDINIKIAAQVSEQQMALINLSMECATNQMELISKSKGVKDIFTGQTSLLNDTNEKIQGIARNSVDIMNESKEEVSAWVEKGVEEASSIVPFTKKVA